MEAVEDLLVLILLRHGKDLLYLALKVKLLEDHYFPELFSFVLGVHELQIVSLLLEVYYVSMDQLSQKLILLVAH